MTKRLPCLATVLGVYALARCAAASVHPTTFDELADALAGNQDIVLTQSIDAQGATWAGTTDYSAHFNGGGFIISNYSGSQLISRLNGAGVFEYVGFTNLNAYYGVIKDLGERLGPHTARVRKVFAVGQMAGSGDQNRAGIVGIIRAGYIDDCWADYPKTGNWCGGVVGYAQSGYVTNCYSISSDVVGYVEAMGGPVISACYYNSDLTDSRGGTPKTTAEMMAQATYAGWDFTNVWEIDEGRSYPQLRNFVPEPATLSLLALGGLALFARHRQRRSASRGGTRMTTYLARTLAPALVVAALLAATWDRASAKTLTWDGPNPYSVHDWYNTLNWSPDGYPDDDDIRIVNSDSPETTADVRISDGGRIEVRSGETIVDLKDLYIGYENHGALLVEYGASLNTQDAWLTRWPGSTAGATIGSEAYWNISEALYVGCAGDAALTIEGGARVWANDTYIAGTPGFIHNNSSAIGQVTIQGNGTVVDSGQLNVGFVGTGKVDIRNGASVASENAFLSYSDGSKGEVSVTGDGSSWTTNRLTVGYEDGRLTIDGGASVTSTETFVGAADGTGTVYVADAGSVWEISGSTYIGGGDLGYTLNGIGYVQVRDGATWNTGTTYVGYGPTSSGYLQMRGATTRWTYETIHIGYEGFGQIEVEGGTHIENPTQHVYLGMNSGAEGVVYLRDAGTYWDLNDLYVGYYGSGRFDMRSGAEVQAGGILAGYKDNGEGIVAVSGADTELRTANAYVGWEGRGRLTATDGAVINVGWLYAGQKTGSDGQVTVTGEDTRFLVDSLYIGREGGDGSVTLSGGAKGRSEGVYIGQSGSGAVVQLSLDGTSTEYEVGGCTFLEDGLLALSGGAVMRGHRDPICIGTGSGDAAVTLTDTGTLLSGDDDVYIGGGAALGGSGSVCVDTGATLRAAGTVEIGETGTLCGNGTVEADAIVGGEVAPGCSLGTLTVTGDLTLLDTATLVIEIGGAPLYPFDQVVVGGTARLAGEVRIELLNGDVGLGQLYQLLDADTVEGAFDSVVLPDLPPPLVWDVSDLCVGGTIRVAPEPATLALVALGGLGALLRRRPA